MVTTTTTTIPVFVNERRTWVVTNIKHYVRRQDIIDYMEREYPTVYDARRKKNIQNYNVDVNSFFNFFFFFCFYSGVLLNLSSSIKSRFADLLHVRFFFNWLKYRLDQMARIEYGQRGYFEMWVYHLLAASASAFVISRSLCWERIHAFPLTKLERYRTR